MISSLIPLMYTVLLPILSFKSIACTDISFLVIKLEGLAALSILLSIFLLSPDEK